MKKWNIVILLSLAQFVMVLDSTVMNVSISNVVKDLNTNVATLQACITFYTLTMAAFMLLGAKLGEIWGRKKAFIIGAIIYGLGSFITGISPNALTLFLGWSVIEGLGAVLVIPAITALIADSYKGSDRVKAYAVIGAISGAAMAAGPLIGGFVTTYLSWRYVFIAETVIMAFILAFRSVLSKSAKGVPSRIDMPSVFLSVAGLSTLVLGILQSKTWGWITPMNVPTINGHEIAPLGISLVAYLILVGVVLLRLLFYRQDQLRDQGKPMLLDTTLFTIKPLKSGLTVLLAQYAIIAGTFFVLPVYLQMTLGYDALQTGMKIFPLSVSLIVFSVIGTRLSTKWVPRRIVRVSQVILIVSSIFLLGSISAELKGWLFALSMVSLGAALGLLASQLGTINMSSVKSDQTSAVGGLQGVFQNLGSSFGTALVGSILIASLSSTFNQNVQASNVSQSTKQYVSTSSLSGVAVVPVSQVNTYAESKGLSQSESQELADVYATSQVESLRTSIYIIIVIAAISLLFSSNIPNKKFA